MRETTISNKIEGAYHKAEISQKSIAPVFQTSSETSFSRAVTVPENGKTALIRIVPQTPRPTGFQARTD